MNIGKGQKRVLLLGGSFFQVPSVQTAKRLGYYTITCDYLPNNPGHQYADEYHNVSTTDIPAVLELAKSLKIDGIVCYASDPAAPTAAYVAEKLGLPGNPYDSVMTLSYKDRFRRYLLEHGFKTPVSGGYGSVEEVLNDIDRFSFPVMVKPVDSCGSKGVSKVYDEEELVSAFARALEYSRCKRIIIEEFVESNGYQVAGDGFQVNGELVFRCFGNDHFSSVCNSLVPVAASFPLNKPEEIHTRIHQEVQRLLTSLEMWQGAYNFDIRLNKSDEPILMEVGCRNGGNMIPQVIRCATGVDMIESTIKVAVGDDCSDLKMVAQKGFWAYYAVHSDNDGVFEQALVSDDVRFNNLQDMVIFKKPGDEVLAYNGSNATVGIMILHFDSMDEMLSKIENMKNFVKVVVR